MTTDNPGFWLRLMWAFRFFFLVLTSREFAREVAVLDQQRQISAAGSESKVAEAASGKAPGTTAESSTAQTSDQTVPAEEGGAVVEARGAVEAGSLVEERRPQAHPKADVEQADATQPLLQMLGLMQQEARFIDFLQEDVTHYGDADIGAAARIVHSGCRKILQQYVSLSPVMTEPEQTRISLAADFDPAEIRLTGRVTGQGPFNGVLMHKGWKVTRLDMPVMASGHNARILAPAEVEI